MNISFDFTPSRKIEYADREKLKVILKNVDEDLDDEDNNYVDDNHICFTLINVDEEVGNNVMAFFEENELLPTRNRTTIGRVEDHPMISHEGHMFGILSTYDKDRNLVVTIRSATSMNKYILPPDHELYYKAHEFIKLTCDWLIQAK